MHRRLMLGCCLLDGVPTEFYELDYGLKSTHEVRIDVVQPGRYAIVIVETSLDLDSLCNRITEGRDVSPLFWMAPGDLKRETTLTRSYLDIQRAKAPVCLITGYSSIEGWFTLGGERE